MKIIEKFIRKSESLGGEEPITIAFLGDSVTQGCFELYYKSNGEMETVYEPEHAYHRYLAQIFARLYPSVPITMLNAGVSSGTASHGLERLHRDVISHQPDLAVVCFGLNDVSGGLNGIDIYISALKEIFIQLQQADIEVIFMTPNMMNTSVSCHLEECFKDDAQKTSRLQNDGTLDAYVEAAKKLCRERKISVCDCYAKWKRLWECGVETDDLLANYINHPTREMNWLFAVSLAETIFSDQKGI